MLQRVSRETAGYSAKSTSAAATPASSPALRLCRGLFCNQKTSHATRWTAFHESCDPEGSRLSGCPRRRSLSELVHRGVLLRVELPKLLADAVQSYGAVGPSAIFRVLRPKRPRFAGEESESQLACNPYSHRRNELVALRHPVQASLDRFSKLCSSRTCTILLWRIMTLFNLTAEATSLSTTRI